jgi:Tfp pilus assembly protein FimT
MVVVVLIGILAVLAIPTMAEAHLNARTLDDATRVAELFREARTRAMARGAAMLVTATSKNANASADLGTYTMWEGQIWGNTAATTALPLPGGSPVSSCGAPIANYWTTVTSALYAPTTQMETVNFNTASEIEAGIWSVINDGPGSVQTSASLCYTPLGKAYYQANTVQPVFVPGVGVLRGQLQVAVQRSEQGAAGAVTGLTRTVIIPDSGSTRIVSR